MKQAYRIKTNTFDRTQIVGKGRMLKTDCTVEEAYARLELAAARLLKEARWTGYGSPINELRKPLLELRLARRKL